MKKVLKNFLDNGNYTLDDAQERIDYAVAKGKVNPKEAEEMLEIAKKKANGKPINERLVEVENALTAMSTNEGKLQLFLDSITVAEKPAKEKPGHTLVQKYDHKSHSIIWEYVKDKDVPEEPAQPEQTEQPEQQPEEEKTE